MTFTIPPDRDPELRRTLALDPEAQCALLASMLPDYVPGEPSDGRSFQHLGVELVRTPSGALSCRPLPVPDNAVLTADSPCIHVLVDHEGLARQHPRLPESIAKLEQCVAQHAGQRGIYRVPFEPPRTWTLERFRRLLDVMFSCTPEQKPATTYGLKFWKEEIHVDVWGDSLWYARVFLANPAIAPGIRFGDEWNRSIADLDKRVEQWQQEKKASHPPDDDDDDAQWKRMAMALERIAHVLERHLGRDQ